MPAKKANKKNYWLQALKEENRNTTAYCVPKKNSQMYKDVKKRAEQLKKRNS